MSVEQARALLERMAADPEFVARVQAAPVDERRAILVESGYGDVKLRHVSQVLPESLGGELSDEEFAAVSGGGATETIVTAASAGALGFGGGAVISIAFAIAA